MSSSSITDPGAFLGVVRERSVPALLVRPVVLPFIHLPLLATGLDSQSMTVAFLALVALNVVAILLGQPDS
jgi:hypothetical protein